MARNFVISTIFQAQDRISAVASRISRSIHAAGQASNAASTQIAASQTRSTTALNRTRAAADAMSRGMSRAGTQAADASQQAAHAAAQAAALQARLTAGMSQAGRAAQQANDPLHRMYMIIGQLIHGATRLRAAFHFQNIIGGFRDAANAANRYLGTLKRIASTILPSPTGLAVGAAALGYGGAKMVQNSSDLEQIETRTIGLLSSNKNFANIKDKTAEAKAINAKILHFSDTQVGEYSDWAQLENLFLARGERPTDRGLQAFGNLAAIHKGGMAGMLETFQSGSRGEVAALDQIPGLQGRTKKGEVTLYYNGEKFDLGDKTAKGYYAKYANALTKISEKYFGELGEMQGKTWDAKWSTFVSSLKVGFDNMLRDTSWWQSLKNGLDSVTNSVKATTPKFVELSETIYKTLERGGFFGGKSQTFLDLINNALNRAITALNSITTSDLEAFRNKLTDGITAIGSLTLALIQLTPSLASFVKLVSNPGEFLREKSAQETAENLRTKGGTFGQAVQDMVTSLLPGSNSFKANLARAEEINRQRTSQHAEVKQKEIQDAQDRVDFTKHYKITQPELFPAAKIAPSMGGDPSKSIAASLTPWFKATDEQGKTIGSVAETNVELKTKMDSLNTNGIEQLAVLQTSSGKLDVQAEILRQVTEAIQTGLSNFKIDVTNNIKSETAAAVKTTNSTDITTTVPNVGKSTTGTAARTGK